MGRSQSQNPQAELGPWSDDSFPYCCLLSCHLSAALPAAENLAPRAAVSANSQYSNRYAPKWAVDGVVPEEASKGADLDHAWCVRKEKSGDSGWFRLEWKDPVTVAEVVYFGRTSWFVNECWRDFALFIDDEAKPVIEGIV